MRMIIALIGSFFLATNSFTSEDEICFPPLVEYHDYWTGKRMELEELVGDYDISEVVTVYDLTTGQDLIFYQVFLSPLSRRNGEATLSYSDWGMFSPMEIEGMFEEQILP